MKAAFKTLLALALVLTVGFVALAEEKGKAVTLKGTITCAKCDLKETKACATVIKTKDGVFYFDAKSGKKNHKAICTEPKEGEVTGVVTEKDGKKTVTVSKVKFNE